MQKHIPLKEERYIKHHSDRRIFLSAIDLEMNLPMVKLSYLDLKGNKFYVLRNVLVGSTYNVLQPMDRYELNAFIAKLLPQAQVEGYVSAESVSLEFTNAKENGNPWSNMSIYGHRYRPMRSTVDRQVYWIPMETR
jgi:hypothetical protein